MRRLVMAEDSFAPSNHATATCPEGRDNNHPRSASAAPGLCVHADRQRAPVAATYHFVSLHMVSRAKSFPHLSALAIGSPIIAVASFLVSEIADLDVFWNVTIGYDILARRSVPHFDRYAAAGFGAVAIPRPEICRRGGNRSR